MDEPLEPKRIPDWEKIWHSGLDYVAPGHEVGSHPAERGDVNWSRVVARNSISEYYKSLNLPPYTEEELGGSYFDIVYTSDYKQEPLPGQWLIYPA